MSSLIHGYDAGRTDTKAARCRPSHLCAREPISMVERRPWLKDPDRPVYMDRQGSLGHYSPQWVALAFLKCTYWIGVMEAGNGELWWPDNGFQCTAFTLRCNRCRNTVDVRTGMPGDVCYIHYRMYCDGKAKKPAVPARKRDRRRWNVQNSSSSHVAG